jgi:phosphoribosyl 1,2-cyclic phosphodiesterase
MVSGGGGRVLIDCGEDWLGRARGLRPDAILISHAHADHAAGLKRGAPCGVYASAESWRAMAAWPLAMRYVVPARHPFALAGLLVEAWPVEHSLLAPAVGYRVTARSSRIFYVPDVALLPNPVAALGDVDLYGTLFSHIAGRGSFARSRAKWPLPSRRWRANTVFARGSPTTG